MKNLYLMFFNNYVGLILEGTLRLYRVYLATGFFLFLVLAVALLPKTYHIIYTLLLVTCHIFTAYFIILMFSMLCWMYYSKKLGLKSLFIFPGSSFWLRKLLARRNIGVLIYDNTFEIHVNVSRKYPSWTGYNSAIDTDVKKIISYLRSGRLGRRVTISFNSFNQRITDKLERAFSEHGRCVRFEKTALPNLAPATYHPARFKKVQMKMFGEVKSTRSVHFPEAWELLIFTYERR